MSYLRLLDAEQSEGLWQTCTANDPASVDQYITSLLPQTPSSVDFEECLFVAVRDGPHYKLIQHLIARYNVSISGHTLIAAVRMDLPFAPKKSLLDFLLDESGWDLNSQVDGWCTLLKYCVYDIEVVEYLLDLGANPNLGPHMGAGPGAWGANNLVSDSGSILATAIENGKVEVVELLVRRGAILENACPVHCAVERSDEIMLLKVLGLGAKIDEPESTPIFVWDKWKTPLHRAVRKGKVNMVRVLLDNGASVYGRGKEGQTVMEEMKKGWVHEDIKKAVFAAWAKID